MQLSTITALFFAVAGVQTAGFASSCGRTKLEGLTHMGCGAGGISGCGCSMQGQQAMICDCPDDKKDNVTQTVDLDACISNNDGSLAC
ncbi:uncharacterized protein PgNI_12148 [Pyricularia grisea]|uniref:Uncharacterized protein n=1 Tax=Pyricularia grisea TaxID=148305 RepID=A0A6P8AQS1_PYRGI|nr:uncharacterized protein PgNI_12148 [Pyricularia grisea]TLD04415.1 hypothetical protein PgNI_12148 [Pyricularia grisea]